MEKKYLDGTQIEDLRGMKLGRLTVVDFDWDRYERDKIRKKNGEIKQVSRYWMCECACGKKKSIKNCHILSGATQSCNLCYTFEEACKDNEININDVWDFNKNKVSPSDISFSSTKKIYIRCAKDTSHPSYLSSACSFASGNRCPVCAGRIVLSGVNDVATTHPHIVEYFSNMDDAKTVTHGSHKKVLTKCKECGREKFLSVSQLTRQGHVSCECGISHSYPNKFMYSLLKQLDVEYEAEKKFLWSNGRIYDIYIPSLGVIIENHGIQHYSSVTTFNTLNGRSLIEEMNNDEYKKCLATNNEIKYYIELDCRYSNIEYIKKSVISSELPKALNFKESDIDWGECERFAVENSVKQACDLWNSGNFDTVIKLANNIDVSDTTARTYLKLGTKYGWTDYNSEKEGLKSKRNNGLKNGLLVRMYKDGKDMGVFPSCSHLSKISMDILDGIFLKDTGISRVCRGERRQYKGFTFKYVEENN